jgi:hypothetical protein
MVNISWLVQYILYQNRGRPSEYDFDELAWKTFCNLHKETFCAIMKFVILYFEELHCIVHYIFVKFQQIINSSNVKPKLLRPLPVVVLQL